MEEGWNTNGGKKRQAGTDGNTAQQHKVTGEEGKRVEELFLVLFLELSWCDLPPV